jgi:hypothetical protein
MGRAANSADGVHDGVCGCTVFNCGVCGEWWNEIVVRGQRVRCAQRSQLTTLFGATVSDSNTHGCVGSDER